MDTTPDPSRPLLLLIGTGPRRNREFVLESVSRRYRLWLLQPAEPGWAERYLTGYSVVDNTDPDKLVDAAQQVARSVQVSGVFCYDEGLVWPAAHVTRALDLVGNTPEAIWSCRDKKATRTALAGAGIPQPVSTGVSSLAQARAAAAEIGYPVVLKPRGLAGSMGVRRADRADQLAEAYDAARSASYPNVPVYDEGVLVEEYVTGPEISVDAVFFDGACTPLVLARKQVGFDPFFEEVGHLVDAADPLLADDTLRGLLERSHAAIGFRYGVTHTEFKLTPQGLRLIEVNARLAGDLIAYLGVLASGVDTAMAAADAAAGQPPEVAFPHRRVAGIRFLYPPHDLRVESVSVRSAEVQPPIHQAEVMAAPGAVLRLPPRGYIARYGYVIAVADHPEEVNRALAGSAGLVRLTGQALDEDS